MLIKRGISFPTTDHAIVEVMHNNHVCSKCGEQLNLLESKDGLVPCKFCGEENKIDGEEK